MGYTRCLISCLVARQPECIFKASFSDRVDGLNDFPKTSHARTQETDKVDFFLDLISSSETGENQTNQQSKDTFQNTGVEGEQGEGWKPKGTNGESQKQWLDRVATNKWCDISDGGLPCFSPIWKVFVTTLGYAYSCRNTWQALTCYMSYNNMNELEPGGLRRHFKRKCP